MMKKLNKSDRQVLKAALQPPELNLEQLKIALTQGATIVDTRPYEAFAAGHIPGTINIPEDGAFTTWAGWLLKYDQPFFLNRGPGNRQPGGPRPGLYRAG